jgi:hypothetical protein
VSEGISAIIMPIMVPDSKRLELADIQFLYELIMTLTIFNTDNQPYPRIFPKIFVMLNNLDRVSPLNESVDSVSVHDWFGDVVDTIREYVADHLYMNIYQNEFNPKKSYQKAFELEDDYDQSPEYISILEFLIDHLLPSKNFFT